MIFQDLQNLLDDKITEKIIGCTYTVHNVKQSCLS